MAHTHDTPAYLRRDLRKIVKCATEITTGNPQADRCLRDFADALTKADLCAADAERRLNHVRAAA